MAHENGFYVTVPVDYADPAQGTTDVYAFFSGGYDENKETLIYFTGGPGQTVHWGLFNAPMPYNVLIMEHRGVGCSRPATVSQYLNPAFYSSENVARDAEMIRRFLQIPQWTVYGISYGTVPATIYASFFPAATRAAILEGVVYSGDHGLWDAPHRRKLLQKMLNGLPENILKRMESISTVHGVPNTWFSQWSRGQLMYTEGLKAVKEKLLRLEDERTFASFVADMKSMYEPLPYTPHPLFIANEIPYYMISCQELGLALPYVSIADALVQGKLSPAVDTQSPATCRQLRATTVKSYSAARYPVKVPVTYFQGSDDGATPSPQAVYHYKNVPQGSKQIMILVRGGHNPNLQLIGDGDSHQLQFFHFAFKGEKIPRALVKEFNEQNDLFWAFATN